MKRKAAVIICTFFGIGYLPLAPGTYASIMAVLIFYFLLPSTLALFIAILIVSSAGIFLTAEIEKSDGKDPKHIVIDEIAGQWLTFLFIANFSIPVLFTGFILFRFFDILKPFGINYMQKFPSGRGVVFDDLLAGVYSNIILHTLILTRII
jgi:phosphatidylglycerophosphatase A